MVSLRRRLLIGTTVGTAIVLLIAGIALYVMMRSSLYRQFDDALLQKASTLAAMIERDDEGIEVEFGEAEMAEFERSDRPEYFQVWLADRTVLARSPSLRGGDLDQPAGPRGPSVVDSATLPDGRPGRVATVQFATRLDDELTAGADRPVLTLALGRDVLDVGATLVSLRLMLVLVGVAATLACVGMLSWQVRVGLRPAADLAREIESIDEACLAGRLDAAGRPAELQPIVHRLNDLLERLSAAFLREKTMTADAAHELRTPLAGLRSTLEVALSREREPAAYRETLTDCLAICVRTQTLVENLLALARLDAGSEAVQREQIDIEALLRETWQAHADQAERKSLHVEWKVAEPLSADTDREKLRLVLNNLFENAVYYSDPNGGIAINGAQDNGQLRLRVSNTGCTLSEADVGYVFDRFWRAEQSYRPGDTGHCGLGLPLAKAMTERLGGSIRATADAQGTFTVDVCLKNNP